MLLLLTSLLIFCLLMVSYEDLKYRGVQWWLFPVLLVVNLLATRITTLTWEFLEQSLISMLLLLLLLILTGSTFYLLKRKKITDALGIGDVLFFIVIIPLFTTWGFIFFLSSSFVLITIVHFVSMLWMKNKTVPLAGYQSVLLIILIVLNQMSLNEPFQYTIANNFLL